MIEKNETIPNYTTKDLKITPNEIDAVIKTINVKTQKDVYGDKAKKPEQEVFVLHLENQEHNVETQDSIAKYPIGDVPDSSNLGLFIKRYGKFEVGMTIKLEKNDKGFWKIRV